MALSFFVQNRQPLTSTTQTFCLQVHRGHEGIQQLRAEWDQLLAAMSRPRYLHFRQWFESSLHALESRPDEMLFCAIHDSNNQLAALLPLKQEQRSAGPIKVRTLELPRHEHMYLRDILVADRAQSMLSLKKIVQLLRETPELNWDILCLWHVLDDSCTMAAYRARAPRLTSCTERSQCFSLPAEPWEQFSKRLSKNFRKSLRAARRRADEQGGFTHEVAKTLPELELALEAFIQIEASGWKGTAGTGSAIAADPTLVEFYRDLTRRFAEVGRCQIHVLRNGAKPVAAQYILLDQTTAYTLKTGYDETYSRLSPGHLLDEATFSHLASVPGLTEINLASDAPYLESWKPLSMKVYNVYAFNRTILGMSGACGMEFVRKWKNAKERMSTKGHAEVSDDAHE